MIITVTGCCGFVGSNLVERLIKDRHQVRGIDNLSTGKFEHIKPYLNNENFRFDNRDISKSVLIENDVDCVVHLAAMADIRYNIENFSEGLHKNINVTNNVIEACVKSKVPKIIFASTCSVYGDVDLYPTPEDCVNNQTSVYSATKIASEKILEGFANTFNFKGISLRFVSMLGAKYSHGHVYDFTKKILNKDNHLDILGDGTQHKSYLHIDDAVDAIITVIEKDTESNYEVFNVGNEETIHLNYSINTIVKHLRYKGELHYGKDNIGWIGDNPKIIPSMEKLHKLGWSAKKTIKEGIEDTIDWLLANQWIFKEN